ncbi:Nucleoside-diphosphate-sugar epimerase [Palleronia marisminoris]|uniref:Putative sugar epimerase YhfK n=1 Tax=Palleronia marisminoris TaxID=315423 RepID=A0A1Y5T2X8_9RHOB|nr:NAD(P)-binding oxidoreductase [Palleronia marisminoris]SFH14856.1 Nucleoside-diphosphate-sugar epimerase [Palleronia marisminoris]SLN54632.1 putative sugar epimerase YhfK [Palleronia marisminoris]
MKVLVIGATGGVGSRLVPMLVESGHEVHGLHRHPEQAKALQRQGATPHAGDLMEMQVADYRAAVRGMDAVVFSAGAGGAGEAQASRIDGDAPEVMVQAMQAEGVGRLVVVSVFPEAGRARQVSDTFEHYMACKKRADVAVARSGLDWVILRPGTLISEDGDGAVTAARVAPYGDVARGDVAAAIAAVLERPWLRWEAVELTDGDVPVGDALDTFRR